MMSRSSFHTLLNRYRNGECNERERQLIEQWLNLVDGDKPTHSAEEYNQIENRIWNAINRKEEANVEEIPLTQPVFLWKTWYAAAAAIVFLVMFLGVYRYQKQVSTGTAAVLTEVKLPNQMVRKINNTSKPIGYKFGDGSKIVLNPQSSVEFPENFASDKREVYLNGKAFFEIERNPDKPFLVHSGDVITKVLGTSFWVEGHGNKKQVEVSVVTGKVSVFQKDNNRDYARENIKSGVVITANQRVKYLRENHTFITSLVEMPVPVLAGNQPVLTNADFKFEDQPLSEIVEKLELAYGIKIVLDNESLNGCLFTGDIAKQPLFTKLDLLCSSIDASYEVRGTSILVSGHGCNSDNLNR
ncbi:FecR family protein [Dyadobacter sp. CY312]|uniref:FecR family protein n=1 Tax=Dyadobacter sp. CY312 TaxID=2907303 RepID=UPI001F31F267|nr:FecR family protein [Dyadobacter sp. CY312]MCE7042826.1 FecR domain-containing protein [Dyadobacter sp. CY312]